MNQESKTVLPLTNTRIVEIDGLSTDIPINFNHQLSPQTDVIGEILICEKNEPPPPVLRLLLTDKKEKIEVVLASGAKFDAISLRGEMKIGTDSYSQEIFIIPARQPVTVINKGNPLTELAFPILNFPPILGSRRKFISDGEKNISIPNIQIKASSWCIEMTGVDDIWDVKKMLEEKRGLGITYIGRITQLNAAEFEVNEAKKLLSALQTFLSFSCGRACGFPLVEGKDRRGQNSWVRWGSHYVHPWNYQHSLLCRHDYDIILQSLFPKFLVLFENDKWANVLVRVINYYLESNTVLMREVGIISAQIALELLSYQISHEHRKYKNKKEAAGISIQKALEELDIATNIPEHCESLRKLKRIYKWKNGPHALTDIRNDIVHPITKFDDSPILQGEVWVLALWYIEMLLLKKLDHQGEYRSRFATGRTKLEPFPLVPWAIPG
ncbi:MAG: hypothetical protein OXH03_06600 [Bacteroidetes bacterium]|nr:hypothetical protein [Bacteroidota bacterium]MDE2672038.1 hypothetical protein [Bacteroidota bacterium]